MTKFAIFLSLLSIVFSTAGTAQEIINETYFPLDKELKKSKVEQVSFNVDTDELCLTMRAKKQDKVKGQKRTFERIQLFFNSTPEFTRDDVVRVSTNDFEQPTYSLTDASISTRMLSNSENPIHKYINIDRYDLLMNLEKSIKVQLSKITDFVRVMEAQNGTDLYLLVDSKVAGGTQHQLKYIVVDLNAMRVTSEKMLQVNGSVSVKGLASAIYNNQLVVVASSQSNNFGISQNEWHLARYSLTGEAVDATALPLPADQTLFQAELNSGNGALVLVAEYGSNNFNSIFPSDNTLAPERTKKWRIDNPADGIFYCRMDANLTFLNTQMMSYANQFQGMMKGKKVAANSLKINHQSFQDIIFLPDGSCYLSANQYSMSWRTKVSGKETKTYRYKTEYQMDGLLLYHFSNEGQLQWVHHLDRNSKSINIDKHSKQLLPVGLLLNAEMYIVNNDQLAIFYDLRTSGWLGGATIKSTSILKDGSNTPPLNYSATESFEVVSGNIIQLNDNTFFLVGYDKKDTQLIVKKVVF